MLIGYYPPPQEAKGHADYVKSAKSLGDIFNEVKHVGRCKEIAYNDSVITVLRQKEHADER